jgi:hypothetical protein
MSEGPLRTELILSLFLLNAGCAKARTANDGASDAAVEAAALTSDVARDASPVEAGAKTHVTNETRGYGDALKRGRALTVSKKYADAIAAFDEALAALPNDARATSERGYARFLSGDTKGAEKDFDQAVRDAPRDDKKLRAQIYFNLGLVNDKEGDREEAQADFRSSYEYNPTSQAKAKMSACPVHVSALATQHFASRAIALATLKQEALGNEPSDVACDDSSCSVILPVASGVVQVDVGSPINRSGSNMDPSDRVSVEKSGGDWVIELGTAACGRLFGCADGTGDGMWNSFDECEPNCGDAGGCMSGSLECSNPAPHTRLWVDATTGAGLWQAEWDTAFADTVETEVVARQLHVTGAGCAIARPPIPAE